MIEKNQLDLLDYINTPMTQESIQILYSKYSIRYEKCELYNDFIQSLILLIFDTYMGDDITNSLDQKNHFKWCWEKTVDSFSKEGIVIDNPKLYKYFLYFMLDVYYKTDKKKENCDNIIKLWVYIFNFHGIKSKSDIDTLIEVYNLFEIGIKSE